VERETLFRVDLPPKVRQVVKTQNPLNGRIE
jgi:hypothetical protein